MSSVKANREYWNRISGEYQRRHDRQIGAAPRLWGNFSLPDRDLGALGHVTGRRVLELGCGAGQWSRALAGEGGQVVGFDLSDAQLRAARDAMGTVRHPLVQGAAQRLPFASASFDLVFCDHGGLSWAPPELAVPEAARVLRPGPGMRSGYVTYDPPDWARRWPCEALWVTHKPADEARP